MSGPRVLVVDASPGWGGALTSLEALIPQLELAGLDVHLACAVPHHTLSSRLHDRVSAPPLPGAPESAHGGRYFARELARATVLLRCLDRLRPTAIIANNAPGTNGAVHLAARARGLPVVQYVRGELGAGRFARWCLRQSASVLAVGADVAAGLPAGVPTLVVDEGLAPHQWPTRRAPGARDLWWCGSLTPWKGLPLAIEAHARAGGGRSLHVCHTVPGALTTSPLPPAPVIGWREPSPSTLDRVRSGCAVMLHTSLTPEPFGRSVLESMAAGLTPVVPDEGTPARLVQHGVSGLHYRARDVRSLADAIERLLGSPSMIEDLGGAAALRAAPFTAARAFAPVVACVSRHAWNTRFPVRNTRCSTTVRSAPTTD